MESLSFLRDVGPAVDSSTCTFCSFFKVFLQCLWCFFTLYRISFFDVLFFFPEETHSLVYLKQAEMMAIVLVLAGAKMHNETLDVWYESKINGHLAEPAKTYELRQPAKKKTWILPAAVCIFPKGKMNFGVQRAWEETLGH